MTDKEQDLKELCKCGHPKSDHSNSRRRKNGGMCFGEDELGICGCSAFEPVSQPEPQEDSKVFYCHECNISFENEADLDNHIIARHEPEASK